VTSSGRHSLEVVVELASEQLLESSRGHDQPPHPDAVLSAVPTPAIELVVVEDHVGTGEDRDLQHVESVFFTQVGHELHVPIRDLGADLVVDPLRLDDPLHGLALLEAARLQVQEFVLLVQLDRLEVRHEQHHQVDAGAVRDLGLHAPVHTPTKLTGGEHDQDHRVVLRVDLEDHVTTQTLERGYSPSDVRVVLEDQGDLDVDAGDPIEHSTNEFFAQHDFSHNSLGTRLVTFDRII